MVAQETIGIGTVLGEYKIEKILGQGGMGVVYKAHESSLNRKVALKVLSQKLSSDKEFITRFKKEAQIIAALNHTNIVSILSFGKGLGHYYFAMEYIKGKDLDEILKEKTTIPLDEALSIARQVADALSEAGEKGVVHRDLKPANIMIDEMNRARVTDFGVARIESAEDNLTKTGMFLGSPQYASPEQAGGMSIDPRSDIYALGAVLYRMLTGTPPTTGDSPLAVVVKVVSESVTPIEEVDSSIPKPVCALIGKMMAKDRNQRYQSAKEVVADIDNCLHLLKTGQAGKVDKTVVQSPSFHKGKTRENRNSLWPWAAGAIGILFLLLLIWGGKSFFSDTATDPLVPDEMPTFSRSSAEAEPPVPAETPAPIESTVLSPPVETPEQPPVQDSEEVAIIATAKPSSLPSATEQISTLETVGEKQKLQAASPENKASAAESLVTSVSPDTPQPKAKTEKTLPEQPIVLLIVSGPEDMTLPLQAQLETTLLDSNLQVISPVEVPVLYEKMQVGDMPVNWYSVRQYTPGEAAHILILAKIQKAGSTILRFHGTSQEQISAMFSVRIMDMDTGKLVDRSISGTIQYTVLNMQDEFQDTLSTTVNKIGNAIQEYWNKKKREKSTAHVLSRKRTNKVQSSMFRDVLRKAEMLENGPDLHIGCILYTNNRCARRTLLF